MPSSETLATRLLKDYAHMRTFEVDPGDSETAERLAEALEARGCTVERSQFSTLLTVTCPDPTPA